ncbi:MAG: oxidoreductase [Planctomycetes bacterium]|nr:oxidoreductase [Planctomycetota bacterium]
MTLLLAAILLLILSGVAALVSEDASHPSASMGAFGAAAGCALGLTAALMVLIGGQTESLRLAWSVPRGAFLIELDPLSAFFLIPTLGLSGLAALYGSEYLQAGGVRRALGPSWFFFNLLVASMAVVLVARNAVLFLMAWEVMSVSSYFLVMHESEKESVREAGWTYLVAAHLGTAFLIVLFLLLGREFGTLDFGGPGRTIAAAPQVSGLLFILALIGFGTKAGFVPVHVWLPEAHPAAPSHVSAVMSGVMVKTGIYGLARILTFLGPPQGWWGWVLIGMGLSSGILGVLFALAQHDLKALLAYHTVENIGIIALGLGLGVLGLSAGLPGVAVLGFAGGLLHVLNHALFKGLLFLGAGAVAHGSGTREMDEMGGLLKRMPWTGATFLVGAVAISGLPPLNGFVSEFLIYLGAISGLHSPAATAVAGVGVMGGLALIGGLAAACFAKAFGIVFLGEPRSGHAEHAHEAGPLMRLSMALLAISCAAIGLLAPRVVRAMSPAIATIAGLTPGRCRDLLTPGTGSLALVVTASVVFLVLVLLLAVLRRALLAGRTVSETGTWDCGYARPTPRMQYSASSFAQPLTDLFGPVLRTERRGSPPRGYFPDDAAFATKTRDVWREELWRRVFAAAEWVLSKFAWLQQGRVHLYILYIALTLLALLIWGLP